MGRGGDRNFKAICVTGLVVSRSLPSTALACGARRMTESAALLADEVLPRKPLRQWVLSLPFALRFLLATNPRALTQVLGVVYRTISAHVLRQARLTRATGAVPDQDWPSPSGLPRSPVGDARRRRMAAGVRCSGRPASTMRSKNRASNCSA